MGCSLSNIPDDTQPLVNSRGILLSSPRLFLNVLQGIIDRAIAISYVFERYDSLSSLDLRYPKPNPDMSAIVTGQGLAIFKASLGPSGTWVLASDDATPIT